MTTMSMFATGLCVGFLVGFILGVAFANLGQG